MNFLRVFGAGGMKKKKKFLAGEFEKSKEKNVAPGVSFGDLRERNGRPFGGEKGPGVRVLPTKTTFPVHCHPREPPGTFFSAFQTPLELRSGV